MTREEVTALLANAAAAGQLGLLVGSGFSIALTTDQESVAPNWRALLERAATELNIAMPDPSDIYGRSFPQIASNLVERLMQARPKAQQERSLPGGQWTIAMRQALWQLKTTIAKLAHLQISQKRRDQWRASLEDVAPAWIVTTNYDLLLEDLIPNSSALLPNDMMPIPRGGPVPVFHLHGHRLDPSSLVVTEEDYTALFRPGDYRQRKLSLLFAESTVLILGYGLGDVNVLSALDLAGTYSNKRKGRAPKVVHALWSNAADSTRESPRLGSRGEIVLPISDIQALLNEVGLLKRRILSGVETSKRLVKELGSDANARRAFAENTASARTYWSALRTHTEVVGNSDVLSALTTILDELWERARRDHGWEHYATYIDVIVAGFDAFGAERAHPSILTLLFTRLMDVARYIDTDDEAPRRGYARDATKRWASSRRELSWHLLEELATRAERCGNTNLRAILLPRADSTAPRQRCPLCGAAVFEPINSRGPDDALMYRQTECTECDWYELHSWPVSEE